MSISVAKQTGGFHWCSIALDWSGGTRDKATHVRRMSQSWKKKNKKRRGKLWRRVRPRRSELWRDVSVSGGSHSTHGKCGGRERCRGSSSRKNWRRGFITYPVLHTVPLYPWINNNRETHREYQGKTTQKAKTFCASLFASCFLYVLTADMFSEALMPNCWKIPVK